MSTSNIVQWTSYYFSLSHSERVLTAYEICWGRMLASQWDTAEAAILKEENKSVSFILFPHIHTYTHTFQSLYHTAVSSREDDF